jgi:hypothetical protein
MASGTDRASKPLKIERTPFDRLSAEQARRIARRIVPQKPDEAATVVAAFGSSL